MKSGMTNFPLKAVSIRGMLGETALHKQQYNEASNLEVILIKRQLIILANLFAIYIMKIASSLLNEIFL